MAAPAQPGTTADSDAHPTFAEIHEETDKLQFRDGSTPDLHIVFWTRTGPVNKEGAKVLIWVHGLGEHSGRYKGWAERLLASVPELDGVASYDQRGHGRSGGTRGLARDIGEFVEDFVEKVSSRIALQFGTETDVVIGGHSLGGAVCAGAAARGDWLAADEFGRVVGVLLSGPAIRVQVDGALNRMLVPFAGVLGSLPGVKRMTKSNGIMPGKLTHDEGEIARMDGDELMHEMTGIGLAADLLAFGGRLVKEITTGEGMIIKEKPVLVLHGEMDRVCLQEGSEMLVRACGENARLESVPKGLHELHFEREETGRKEYFEKIVAFLADVFGKEK